MQELAYFVERALRRNKYLSQTAPEHPDRAQTAAVAQQVLQGYYLSDARRATVEQLMALAQAGEVDEEVVFLLRDAVLRKSGQLDVAYAAPKPQGATAEQQVAAVADEARRTAAVYAAAASKAIDAATTAKAAAAAAEQTAQAQPDDAAVQQAAQEASAAAEAQAQTAAEARKQADLVITEAAKVLAQAKEIGKSLATQAHAAAQSAAQVVSQSQSDEGGRMSQAKQILFWGAAATGVYLVVSGLVAGQE